MTIKYRQSVLAELARHGVQPTGETPVEMVREFVNDLYLIEIRSLRDRLRAGLIPKGDYAREVERLRNRYPVLSLPARHWVEE